MKHYELSAIVTYLQNFKNIKIIKRVDNNTIKIEFDKLNIIYFDLTKGNSQVYKIKHANVESRNFNAPFDIILQKKFTNTTIKKVFLLNNDRIIRFEISSKSSYKEEITYLQLEFTGTNTNIIILDQNEIVLEALRHISENISTRVVKVGQKLDAIPLPSYSPKSSVIDDIEEYLYDIYDKKESKVLQNIKSVKLNLLKKEEQKIQNILNSLPNKEALELDSQETYIKANILLSNTYLIKPYQKDVVLEDFSGNKVSFDLSNVSNVSMYINKLFTTAKKYKQKAQNLYIEKENLEQKLSFIKKVQQIILNAKSVNELEFYLPKKEKNQTKTKKEHNYQLFMVDGYKIMLGRNERENIELLENAKANDFWFHLKDSPSAHVIVPTSKKELPINVIETAAKICAEFSTSYGGDYWVDYTKRRELKIQTKANVLYNNYQTIKVKV
ncbi:NFACT RNA binding domain-containing protein [Arcobacter sp. FWKO B]|uniref:NFACT RNA binding domain-containing protein n=1 Tax=Arcobacter sp. FWKO B TaxID=2593672 RepID=UPI0018A3D9CA|nr:NFACT RNA binding domain-containing protein [Arcobacter sp. FWKO B]QOG12132.1 DUF814 domain-containing protein [Arcobacter sp. FWKO B]